MRRFRIFSCLILILLLFSCASSSKEIKTPPIKIYKVGYGFTPFNEPGWVLVDPNNRYAIDLVKQGPSPNSTYAIQIMPKTIPEFKLDASFYDYVKSNYSPKKDDNPEFEIEKFTIEEFYGVDSLCFEMYFKTIDKNAVKRVEYPGHLILESNGYLCRHPDHKDIMYIINYSHRYHEKQKSAEVNEMSQRVLNNFTFIEVY